MRPVHASLLVVVLLGAPARAQAPALDADALDRSLKMLRLEMKLRIIQTYSGKAGLYLSPSWPRRYLEEYRQLEAGVTKGQRIASLDAWLVESTRARENEALEMVRLVQKHLPALLESRSKEMKEKLESFKSGFEKLEHDRRKGALPIARYVEEQLARLVLVNKGKDDEALLAAFSLRWQQSARAVYRGAIKDTDNLITSITAFEYERLQVQSRLLLLKEMQTGLDLAKAAEHPIDKLLDVVQDKAVEKLQSWLKEHYTDVEDETVKKVWGLVKGTGKEVYKQYGKLKDLDSDVNLKGNPTALAAIKRLAILGALYNYTLGKVKDLPAVKAIGPVFDLLSFYGDVLKTLPDLGPKMAALVARVDQDFRGVRANDAFNLPGFAPGQLQQLKEPATFGLLIATDSRIDMMSPQARFYLLVPKTVVPRGYATLKGEQLERLLQALADERFLNAPSEASRGVADWVTENLFEWRNTNPLSPSVSDSYLGALKGVSRKTPFSVADALHLAQGESVSLKGKEWTADKLRSRAEITVDLRVEEMIIRQALGEYRHSYNTQWRAFKALLQRHGVALTPAQILKLFSYYHRSGATASHLETYLKALAAERAARAGGLPRLGVPLVVPMIRTRSVAPGTVVNMTADVLVSDLAPGRSVQAEIVWQVLPGSDRLPPQRVTLRNGVTQLETSLTIPQDARGGRVEFRATVRVPRDPGESALATAIAALPSWPENEPRPVVPTEPRQASNSYVIGEGIASEAPLGHGNGPVLLLNASTARHVTRFKLITPRAPVDRRNIVKVRISARGDRIAYASYQGVFVVNASDGKQINRLSKEYSGHVDISEDGNTVAWHDRDGLHVSGSDGSSHKVTKADGVRGLHLTSAGDRVIVLESNSALSRYMATGAELQKQELIQPRRLNAALGEKKSERLGSIWPENLGISDNGKRIVFRYKDYILGMDGDGKNVRVLKKMVWKGSHEYHSVAISGDGKIVACRVGPDRERRQNEPSLFFVTWEGKDLPTAYINEPKLHGGGGERLQLTRDGSRVAFAPTFGQLHLFDSQRHRVSTPTFAVPLYLARSAAINQDASRACLIIDAHGGHQLVFISSRHETLGGVPSLKNIRFSSRWVSATAPLTVSAQSEPGVTLCGYLLLDSNSLRGAGWFLKDQAKKGESRSLYHTYSDKLSFAADPGPLTFRLVVHNKNNDALAIDLEGFESTVRDELAGSWATHWRGKPSHGRCKIAKSGGRKLALINERGQTAYGTIQGNKITITDGDWPDADRAHPFSGEIIRERNRIKIQWSSRKGGLDGGWWLKQ